MEPRPAPPRKPPPPGRPAKPPPPPPGDQPPGPPGPPAGAAGTTAATTGGTLAGTADRAAVGHHAGARTRTAGTRAQPGPAVPPGRGPRSGRRDGSAGRGMPWLGANGLLPGRGRPPPSRPPPSRPVRMPWLGANGLLPGRGAPGRGPPPGRGAAAPGRRAVPGRGGGGRRGPADAASREDCARAAGAAGASGAAGAGAGRRGGRRRALPGSLRPPGPQARRRGPRGRPVPQGLPGPVPPGRAVRAAGSRRGLRLRGCLGGRRLRGTASSPAALPSPLPRSSAGNVSLILRTTGGSMVEDGRADELALLFRWASSGLALDAELFGERVYTDLSHVSPVPGPCRTGRPDRRYCWGMLIAEFSSGAHQRQTRFRFHWVGRFLSTVAARGSWPGPRRSRRPLPDPAAALVRSARPNARRRRAWSRQSPVGCSHAPRPGRRCRGSGTSRDCPGLVRLRDHSQECRPAIRPATSHTRPGRLPARCGGRAGAAGRSPVRSVPTSLPRPAYGVRHRRLRTALGRLEAPARRARRAAVSGRMSMRQPVSLAARRAFCPSLPMARESW